MNLWSYRAIDHLSIPYMERSQVKEIVKGVGATAVGIARVAEVDAAARQSYLHWIESGRSAPLGYMDRYHEVRNNPRLLLDGANSIIVAAFSYYYPTPAAKSHFTIARYARGADYHDVVRRRLNDAVTAIIAETALDPLDFRVCVDTAPLRERYWARKAGVGFIGRNNALIVPGEGSYMVLGEILTTMELDADAPCTLTCGNCMACVKSCPAGALDCDEDGYCGVDASRCLSCLTIEHRGDFPEEIKLGGRIAGCDTCQDVCPHNRHAKTSPIAEFAPSNPLLDMTDDQILSLRAEDIRPLTRHTSLSRIKPSDFIRNIHTP